MDVGKLDNLKVAIVYDRVNKLGGAERVLLAIHQIFPKAHLFTSVYNPKKALWAKAFPGVETSFLQKIPFVKSWHQGFGWIMPIAFESFNFDKYDLVISLTSEAAKGIITKPKTRHVCYMLTPTRYLWSHYDVYFDNFLLKFVSKPIVDYLRSWDKIAAFRPDEVIAISQEVKERIKIFYDIDSDVIYPPFIFDSFRFQSGRLPNFNEFKPKEYYLVVSRLEPYKMVDLAVRVFNDLKLPLVVVGTGSQMSKLRKMAHSNIHFVGYVDDTTLSFYYQNAKALIMPQEEDFGLVSLEAQNFYLPVIAYKKGGALDTVWENKTGVFFANQDAACLVDAINKFAKMDFSQDDFRYNLQKFSFSNFKERFLGEIEKLF
ncbi:MAG: glycosyl transferase [Patescibacteria group bacterium]|nr:MAG: glycosyl transferase [Patescibacteria group bacterium]